LQHRFGFGGGLFTRKIFSDKFYDVIDPVIHKVRKEVNAAGNKKSFSVGIIGTKGTIEDGMHERKLGEINSKIKIYSKACPLLVSLVEEGMANHEITKNYC